MSHEEYDEGVDAAVNVFNQENPKASFQERGAFISLIPRAKEAVSKRVTKNKRPETLELG